MELLALILLFLSQFQGPRTELPAQDPLAVHCALQAQSPCGAGAAAPQG